MPSPDDRSYSESHEWHKIEGDTLTLGVTRHAVDELTDVTYVEMKPVGTTFEPGDDVGEIESVKATTEVYCAIGGEIIEVNESLAEDPSQLNSDPYGAGWLVRVRVADPAPMSTLMDAATYDLQYAAG